MAIKGDFFVLPGHKTVESSKLLHPSMTISTVDNSDSRYNSRRTRRVNCFSVITGNRICDRLDICAIRMNFIIVLLPDFVAFTEDPVLGKKKRNT